MSYFDDMILGMMKIASPGSDDKEELLARLAKINQGHIKERGAAFVENSSADRDLRFLEKYLDNDKNREHLAESSRIAKEVKGQEPEASQVSKLSEDLKKQQKEKSDSVKKLKDEIASLNDQNKSPSPSPSVGFGKGRAALGGAAIGFGGGALAGAAGVAGVAGAGLLAKKILDRRKKKQQERKQL